MKGEECEIKVNLYEVLHVLSLINKLFSIENATTRGLKVEFEQE
jgi:hypothetical protein